MKTNFNTVLGYVFILIVTLACKDLSTNNTNPPSTSPTTPPSVVSPVNCNRTTVKIKKLTKKLKAKTNSISGSPQGVLADQYIYFPNDVDQLVASISKTGGTAKMKKCPCNDMPMVLSNVYIEYEPKISRGKIRSKDEGGRYPIKNRLILTEVSGELENVDVTQFKNAKLKPHTKGATIVAIIDTGVDNELFTTRDYLWTPHADAYQSNHSRLQKIRVEGGINLFPNGAELTDVDVSLKEIYSFPKDDEGHGTAVAAVVNRVAQDGFQYMIIKGLDRNGNSTLFDMICSIEYAYENGAEYINTSWGFYGIGSAKASIEEMKSFFEDQQRTPKIFASLGNEGINVTDLTHFPSQYSNDFSNIDNVSAATGGMKQLSVIQNTGIFKFAKFSNFSCSDRSIIYPAGNIHILNQVIRGTSFAAPQALAYQYLIDINEKKALSKDLNDTYKLAELK